LLLVGRWGLLGWQCLLLRCIRRLLCWWCRLRSGCLLLGRILLLVSIRGRLRRRRLRLVRIRGLLLRWGLLCWRLLLSRIGRLLGGGCLLLIL
jgi:hypothetical protein